MWDKNQKQMYKQNKTKTNINTENRSVVTREEGGWWVGERGAGD